MRSRATNILQVIVILTGIVYIVVGLFFFISPIKVLMFFAENVAESWVELIRTDELVAPLYNILQAFSALLFVNGIAMVMPLFEPYRYRGLIYYNGLIFPLMSSVMLLKTSLITFMAKNPGGENAEGLYTSQQGHLIILVLGAILALVFILNLIGILITRKAAQVES